MEEHLDCSVMSEKPNTKKTNVLTPDQALEILQQAIIECQKAGIKVGYLPLYEHGAQLIQIILADVAVVNGNLVAINGNSHINKTK